GVTVLALAPRLRRALPGAALAGLIPAASLLPFVLGGDFGMFHYAWFTRTGVPRLVFGADYPFTWPLRVAEGAMVCAVGIPLARQAHAPPGDPVVARNVSLPAGTSGQPDRRPASEVTRRGGVLGFIQESWAELQKVEWPTQNQVIQGTVVVIVACIIVGAFLY